MRTSSILQLPFLRVRKMRSNQYVDGSPLQKTAELKRAAVRWSRVAYAAGGANCHTWYPSG